MCIFFKKDLDKVMVIILVCCVCMCVCGINALNWLIYMNLFPEALPSVKREIIHDEKCLSFPKHMHLKGNGVSSDCMFWCYFRNSDKARK